MEGRVCHTTGRYNINGKAHQCLEPLVYANAMNNKTNNKTVHKTMLQVFHVEWRIMIKLP
jgi:hypothetical protein